MITRIFFIDKFLEFNLYFFLCFSHIYIFFVECAVTPKERHGSKFEEQ